MKIGQIFENNKNWVKEKLNHDRNYFNNLSKGQNPDILYIGCSDSRIAAEEFMGVAPGDVFIHRNIANMVPNADLSVLSVINYAILQLKVKHIIVCGHYFCGGVKAAMESTDFGLLNPWLKNIRDVYHHNKKELNSINDETERYHRFVELNVEEQCLNVMKIASVQKAFVGQQLTIHGWVFNTSSGNLIDLKMDFRKLFDDILETYRVI